MAQSPGGADLQSAVAHIKFGADGAPFVEGHRCRSCSAAILAPRLACPACGARGGFDAFQASATGRLLAYSIVKRSFPGIATPFISAVVTLDDGLTLKANLYNMPFESDAIAPNMPVKLIFNDALGRQDKDGRSYVAYGFEPVNAQIERS